MRIKRDTLRKTTGRKRRKSCKPFRRVSRKRRKMSGGAQPVPLAPEDWRYSEGGEIVNGVLGQSPTSRGVYFKHPQELQGGDVWSMRVTEGGGALVGFANEGLDVERWGETYQNTAWVELGDGTTVINSGISPDGEDHYHEDHLKDHIPETEPYDLALRINKDGNLPQIQFYNDCAWHDFAPGRAALSEGPYFPFLQLSHGDKLSSHSIVRPKATKSAGKAGKEAMAAKAAGAGASSASRPASSNARKTRAQGRSKSAIPRTVSTRQKSKKKTP